MFQTIKNIVLLGLNTLSSCAGLLVLTFVAIVMLNVVVVLIKQTGIIPLDSKSFTLLNTMVNEGFYYLPIFIAVFTEK